MKLDISERFVHPINLFHLHAQETLQNRLLIVAMEAMLLT